MINFAVQTVLIKFVLIAFKKFIKFSKEKPVTQQTPAATVLDVFRELSNLNLNSVKTKRKSLVEQKLFPSTDIGNGTTGIAA